MKLGRSVLLTMTLSLMVACGAPLTSATNAVSGHTSRTVGMWVEMLWFDDDAIDYHPWPQYTRLTPEFGQYNSYDFDFIYYTLRNAEGLGVDYLILDDTNGVFREGAFDLTIQNYLTAIKLTHSPIKIAIATGAEIWAFQDWQQFLSSVNHLEQYFSDPAYYQVDGKPMLVLYISSADPMCSIMFAADAVNTESECVAKYASESDPMGYRTYFRDLSLRYASSDPWFYDELGIYGWRFLYPQILNANTMGVMPGWSRSHNGLTTGGPAVERDDGTYYSESWEYVLNHPPQNLVITAWDDWAEETAIAPATAWGTLYLDLTRNYISLYKSI
jgi:hypothetical protein